ncbi:MAG: trypsin-like peptidase domain-containing protein [Armatimonadota bacterium]
MRNYRNIIWNTNRKSLFFVILVIVIFIGLIGKHAVQSVQSQTNGSLITDEQKTVLYSLENAFSSIAARSEPGVVSITALQRMNEDLSSMGESSFDEYDLPADKIDPDFGFDEPTVTASGSGAIVQRQGDKFYILTNYHVIENAYKVNVRLFDETLLKGIVVGLDPVTDLAVVQISSPRLSDKNILVIGDSNTVKVGSWALALGTPYGFDHSLTVGVVSALHRELEDDNDVYPDLIQTDAAINKGNSGGPLLDIDGRIIGVNSAIASPTGGFIGLGFAIPINNAKTVLSKLIKDGRVIRGWLGIGIQELTPVLQAFYKVDSGVIVSSVDIDGPAGQSGITDEDIITRVDDTDIQDVRQLQRLIGDALPNRKVTVDIVRKGKKQSVGVQIGLLPSTPAGRPVPPAPPAGISIKVVTLTSDLANRIGINEGRGVMVLDMSAGCTAEEAGLEKGDIIVALNRTPLQSEKQFNKIIGNTQQGGIVVLKILRDETPRIIGFYKD